MTVADILNLLDDHGFGDTSTADKGTAINDAYFDLCARNEWDFLEVKSAVTTVGDGTTDTFSNWPANVREIKAIINSATGQVLLPERAEVVIKKFSGFLTQSGDPTMYYMVANVPHLYPIPSGVQSFVVLYLQYPTKLTAAGVTPTYSGSDSEATILLPPRHHRAIVDGALKYLYKMEDDPELAVGAQGEFESRIAQMQDELFRRTQADRPDRVYVTDEDQDFGDL